MGLGWRWVDMGVGIGMELGVCVSLGVGSCFGIGIGMVKLVGC